MLPHFVQQDLDDVVGELNEAGYPLRAGMVRAAFRIPLSALRHDRASRHRAGTAPGDRALARAGRRSRRGRHRRATSIRRVERLQVLVNGMVDPRHVVTCNGRRVPLHPTGTNGQFVAGVRYRAWQPPNCLHPDDRRSHAAGVRHRGHLVGTIDRRLHLSRRASGRPELRPLPGERLRGREPPHGAVLQVRPHAGADDRRRRTNQQGISLHAGPADAAIIDIVNSNACNDLRLRTSPKRDQTAAARHRRSLRGRHPHLRDEMIEPDGDAAPALAADSFRCSMNWARRSSAPLGARAAAHPRKRRHPQRLRRSQRPGPAVEPGPDSRC